MIAIAADNDVEALRRSGLLRLQAAGVSNARNECEWLARSAFARGPGVTPETQRRFRKMISDRCARKPVAYILGTQPFLRFEFSVDSSVLIPRRETELLVQSVLDQSQKSIRTLLDVGT